MAGNNFLAAMDGTIIGAIVCGILGVLLLRWAARVPVSNPKRGTWGAAGVAFCVIAGILILGFLARRDPLPMAGTTEQATVSDDWRLRRISDNQVVSLASLAGKVVFINLWATWCGPCILEMPSIQALYSAFKDEPDIEFLLIADDSPQDALSFMAQHGYTMPVYMAMERPPAALAVAGIPATFVIGKDQKLHRKVLGEADWNSESVHQLLRTLIDAESVSQTSSSSTAANEPK